MIHCSHKKHTDTVCTQREGTESVTGTNHVPFTHSLSDDCWDWEFKGHVIISVGSVMAVPLVVPLERSGTFKDGGGRAFTLRWPLVPKRLAYGQG